MNEFERHVERLSRLVGRLDRDPLDRDPLSLLRTGAALVEAAEREPGLEIDLAGAKEALSNARENAFLADASPQDVKRHERLGRERAAAAFEIADDDRIRGFGAIVAMCAANADADLNLRDAIEVGVRVALDVPEAGTGAAA